jgi:microcystin-dependent protein
VPTLNGDATAFLSGVGTYLKPTATATTEGVWNYSTNNAMADPGSGKFRTNTTTFSSATALALSDTTAQGTDRTNLLTELRTGDVFTVQDRANAANYVRYSVSASPTNNATWFQIPVAWVNGGGSAPANNTDCIFAFGFAPQQQAPLPHAATHNLGGSDAIAPDWTQVQNKPAVPAPSSTSPAMDGTAAVGTGTTYARADHVHPSDTSRMAVGAAPTAHQASHVTGTDQIPSASASTRGLLAQLSGASTDYVGGDNACHALPTFAPASIMDFAGASAPTGWLLCQGQAVNRTTYAALYTALGGAGSPWGQGDGSTTFNVPDLRSRVSVGAGQGAGLTNRVLAASGGEETHTQAIAELPAHSHTATQGTHTHTDTGHVHNATVQYSNSAQFASGGGANSIVGSGTVFGTLTASANISTNSAGAITVANTGSGTPFNVMPPFVTLNKIIKT